METLFHLSAGDPDEWRHALQSVETLLADEETDAEPTVVVTGNAAYAVLGSAPIAETVRELLTEGAGIVACSNALGKRGINPENLVAGVDIADSGVGELTRRQANGAAYVKVP